MNFAKCRALKAELEAADEPALVPAERFFDGNDDAASIGCNLAKHPGVDRFRQILTDLAQRPDVRSVQVVISDADPGEEYWPFSDVVLIAGEISDLELRRTLAPLKPDEVLPAQEGDFGVSDALLATLGPRVLAARWD
jgi:hypothetical protein